MSNCKNANFSIGCTVSNCLHHCQGQDYCTLDKVKIGSHESNPDVCKCVDCESFQNK